jgi:hypothetical protein
MSRKNIATAALLLTTASVAPPVAAEPVPPSALPDYVPAGSSAASRHISEQPSNWNSLTPWGEAINTSSTQGYVKIRSWDMTCDVNGNRTTVVSSLNDVGAALYLTQPWYGNDENTQISPQKTENGLRMPVVPGKVTHWWLNTPRPTVENAQNCEVTAQVKTSPGVFVAIGGDWWIDPTSGWAGQNVNNKYMGRSDWHNYLGGWQTIQFGKPTEVR